MHEYDLCSSRPLIVVIRAVREFKQFTAMCLLCVMTLQSRRLSTVCMCVCLILDVSRQSGAF